MIHPVTVAILVAAGAALVLQNLLMVRITSAVSSATVALLVNSGIGFALLLALVLARQGWSGLADAAGGLRPWAIVPGLLGSFFVYAGLLGYQRIGAAATISILVASQLIVGLAADAVTSRTGGTPVTVSSLFGAVLLFAGAVLITQARA
jgi:transporter family-2 protein